MTHTFKILILTACCIAISMFPAAAATLDTYLGTVSSSGPFSQTLNYAAGNSSQIFTDGNLQFQFTGLTIITTCTAGSTQVACQAGSYNPVSAVNLNVAPTSSLLPSAMDGFDLQGQVSVSSYLAGDVQVDVQEDIDLNYTVSTIGGAASITDAHLDVGACASDSPGTCLQAGTGLPPNMTVDEFFAGTNQTIEASAPPNILGASTTFSTPYSSLQVAKDIFLESGACANCTVGFSDLKQYYSQVPEPRTYAWVLGLGLFGLIQLRRRFVTNE